MTTTTVRPKTIRRKQPYWSWQASIAKTLMALGIIGEMSKDFWLPLYQDDLTVDQAIEYYIKKGGEIVDAS